LPFHPPFPFLLIYRASIWDLFTSLVVMGWCAAEIAIVVAFRRSYVHIGSDKLIFWIWMRLKLFCLQ
jgi:hypothetical protein